MKIRYALVTLLCENGGLQRREKGKVLEWLPKTRTAVVQASVYY